MKDNVEGINLENVKTNLILWEKDIRIKQLEDECESRMKDTMKLKEEIKLKEEYVGKIEKLINYIKKQSSKRDWLLVFSFTFNLLIFILWIL